MSQTPELPINTEIYSVNYSTEKHEGTSQQGVGCQRGLEREGMIDSYSIFFFLKLHTISQAA
jgi:hypothetical protein